MSLHFFFFDFLFKKEMKFFIYLYIFCRIISFNCIYFIVVFYTNICLFRLVYTVKLL